MKETVASEFGKTRIAAPQQAAASAAFARTLAARSQIVWGEHCSECDYPRCYAGCAFYDPRPDLNCRRFEAGIEDAGGGLTRIRFRKWGKLEGHGPAALHAAAEARKRERRDARVGQALAAAPLPFALARSLTWRWNARKARQPEGPAPDAFVVEGWTNDGTTRAFTLTFLQGPATHQVPFQLGPAYARVETPVPPIDLAVPYLVQIEPVGEAEGIDAVFGLIDFVRYTERPVAKPAPLAKVIVWDLDETLWIGTLAEDGVAGVTPRPEAVEAIRALDARGVLQSIASKNDEAEALAALKAFGLDDYFLHPQVNWGPKSQSMARIAQALDLGLDSFVFIDDQPFERGEVEAAHAKVRTLAHTDVAGLTGHPWFDHPVTPESGQRRALYRDEARRVEVLQAAGGDYLAFLRGSALELDIRDLTAADAERVFELSQRTNQLNFTGDKLTRDQVTAMLAPDPDIRRLTLRCRDRFGDYGLIGFVEISLQAAEITQFFMSCRVQRKRVEHALFGRLRALAQARGHAKLAVRFRATERNGAAVRMLEELAFTKLGAGWVRGLESSFADSDIVRVAALAEAA